MSFTCSPLLQVDPIFLYPGGQSAGREPTAIVSPGRVQVNPVFLYPAGQSAGRDGFTFTAEQVRPLLAYPGGQSAIAAGAQIIRQIHILLNFIFVSFLFIPANGVATHRLGSSPRSDSRIVCVDNVSFLNATRDIPSLVAAF